MAETYLPFISIIVAVLGVVFTYFGFIIKVKEDIASIKSTVDGRANAFDSLPQMQRDIATLTAANDVWWKVLGPHLGGIIHSPIHKRRDQLMDEWLDAKGKVPEADLRELRGELEEMLDEAEVGNSQSLILAGVMILSRVEAQINALDLATFQSEGV